MNRPPTLGFLPSLAIMGVMIVALGLVACNGSAALSPAGTLPATLRSGAVPETKPSSTPIVFEFVPVSKPEWDVSVVTGINDTRQIVGYYGGGSSSDPVVGYKGEPPYGQSQFLKIEYPGAISTWAMGLTNGFISVGYYYSKAMGGYHTFGFAKDHGLFQSYKDPETPKGPNTVNELLGVDDNGAAVGFYSDTYGNNHAYELYLTEGKYVGLKPPGFVSTEAEGINDPGNVVGFGQHTDGTTHGWIYLRGVYKDVSYPYAVTTEALGINYQNQVVGKYTNSDGKTHGFIATNFTGGAPTWQSIDEPDGVGRTVVYSVNDHHAIGGSYVDSSGDTDAFMATPCVSSCSSSRKATIK